MPQAIVGYGGVLADETEQRLEGRHWSLPAIKAEDELVEVVGQVLPADSSMRTPEPRLEVLSPNRLPKTSRAETGASDASRFPLSPKPGSGTPGTAATPGPPHDTFSHFRTADTCIRSANATPSGTASTLSPLQSALGIPGEFLESRGEPGRATLFKSPIPTTTYRPLLSQPDK